METDEPLQGDAENCIDRRLQPILNSVNDDIVMR
jgi:hypothetical protein